MEWWNDPSITKMYAVGQNVDGVASDGQEGCWMLEGLFADEETAVAFCTEDYLFVTPLPVGMMTGQAIPDGFYWPRIDTKEQGQLRLDNYRLNEAKKASQPV